MVASLGHNALVHVKKRWENRQMMCINMERIGAPYATRAGLLQRLAKTGGLTEILRSASS